MGLDCVYQAIPANSEVIKLAEKDLDFAKEVLYTVIRFGEQYETSAFFKEPEFDIVRKLFKEYPYLKTCSYSPVSRMQQALIYVLNPNSYFAAKNFTQLEQTLPYKIVKGERVFRDDFRSTQGFKVRVSSPEFVIQCAEFFQNIDLKMLASKFDAIKMTRKNIYKISELTNFESIEDYFVNLSNFYLRVSNYGELAVFVTED